MSCMIILWLVYVLVHQLIGHDPCDHAYSTPAGGRDQ